MSNPTPTIRNIMSKVRKPEDAMPGEKLTVFINTDPKGPGNYVEQNDANDVTWISVRLSEEYCHTRTDIEIMEYVLRAIETKRAIMSGHSLWEAGNRMISFPTPSYPTDEKRWRKAKLVAKIIDDEIREGKCVLDRKYLFFGLLQ